MAVITYREAVRQTLREEMERDDRIFLIGEDIGAFGGSYSITTGFHEEFGRKRVIDSPMAESIIVGMSIGAAMAGLRPVPELMTINFSLLAMDQIVNHAAKLRHMFNGQITGADDHPHRRRHGPTVRHPLAVPGGHSTPTSPA